MQIGWIQLLDFRSYHTLSYSPSSRLNLITGRNAQGKTNLLEAFAVLLSGRSFRTSRLSEVPRWGVESASVTGEVSRVEGSRTLRRVIRRQENGAWQAAGDSCPWTRVIAFGWKDLEIVNGGPAARRDFVDGFAARLYPRHLPELVRYRQIVARRNRVLQLHGRETGIADALAPWDEQLATVGADLSDRRRRAIAALQSEFARVYDAMAGSPQKVEITYRGALVGPSDRTALLAALERARGAEVRRGLTLVGPHRDDLALELDGVDARTYGSRGQQRLLALALRLAEVLPVTEAVGTAPVLLLDDALSELDPRVRGRVLAEIQGAEQVFLTTPEPIALSGAAVVHVREGGLAAA